MSSSVNLKLLGGLTHVLPASVPDADHLSLRSLDFFHHMVAPILSGPLRRTLWTSSVTQLVYEEPAARHAAIAISALYEQFDRRPEEAWSLSGKDFAMLHYNRAIRQVLNIKELGCRETDTVLVVSILFICIEFLFGNSEAAINHCRHGISLMNASTSEMDLVPIFRHLSLVQLFFPQGTSKVPILANGGYNRPFEPFRTFSEALDSLDSIIYDSIALARYRDHARATSATNTAYPPAVVEKQRKYDTALDSWLVYFHLLTATQEEDIGMETLIRILQTRWLVTKIWTNCCLKDDEEAYDAYLPEFEWIVEIASLPYPEQDPFWSRSPKFSFEVGLAQQLYFVVIKCRSLSIRLKALLLIREKCCRRETLFDSDAMICIGQQIIETEHGVQLGLDPEKFSREIQNKEEYHSLPAETQRLQEHAFSKLDLNSHPQSNRRTLSQGRRKLYFHLPTSECREEYPKRSSHPFVLQIPF
ncbi:C6 zinc finger domain-containing protein [Penicillium macrosclerotiorum]|uniref:C6 zinc finger domain-containing protein n=1 Tax=Penicillium macrosclerotiorum TaxID=303699 RepID=UPI0025479ED2|nr:C6 zinc finger domain-containing protein [Penicillium macrosclerotiorum]KAJ5675452.1 C6 zinc finger domain-containing protein [Penicillium macrosclerotiorum]